MKIKIGLGAISLSELAKLCGGIVVGNENLKFSFVCTDSREADEKTLFIAIRGERVDGHDYIAKAAELGCRCVLSEQATPIEGIDMGFVTVPDSVAALSDIAREARRDEGRITVAITGSVGKTTTKEMVGAALASRDPYKTKGNYNSVIGLPLSMLEMEKGTKMAVFEMGMSGFSEIERMSLAATPDIAIVTNIGSSHLEMLGSRENIRKAKLEITAGLREGGVLLLNGDDPMLADLNLNVKTMSVGVDNENCDFRATSITQNAFGTDFIAVFPNGARERCHITQLGVHNVQAALFGLAAASLAGIDPMIAKNGIASFVGVKMRQNMYKLGNITVVEDCYNASPESMRAAISVATSLGEGRVVCFLGDMKELGDNSPELHREVGEFAAEKGIGLLVTYGELAKNIAKGAADIPSVCCEGGDPESAADKLCELLRDGDVVLFKASRSMQAEKVIECLKKRMEIKNYDNSDH